MSEERSFSQLVVIGASAGGIDALSTLVETLPLDLPAPIIIAQHLDPSRVSHLAEILGRHSTLPVVTGIGEHPLLAGHVYVIPSASQVEVTDHHIAVTFDEGMRPMPSIDLLFSTAAHIFQENLIAVILTGSGSDGSAGARDVKAAGGTVIVQNPDTAQNPSMPLSLAPSIVDIIVNLESIGALLGELLDGSYPSAHPQEDRQLRTLLDQLRERSGIDFNSYKMPTITRRLHRRMAATGTTKIGDYIRFLQRNPDEYQRLINSFLIKVTEFFRDPELFEYLRDVVLPQIIDEARAHGELRIWSAGCATGEEAYSLAILVQEALGADADGMIVRIFATDLDAEAVAFARRGIYPSSALADVPADLIQRYFTRHGNEYAVGKAVRSLVVFGQHDLGQRAPFPRIDLTLCRNVLIYFTPDLQKRALQLFAFALRDRGFLALGKAETVNPLPEYFALEQQRLKVFRRIGDRVLLPSARTRDVSPFVSIRMLPSSNTGHYENAISRLRRDQSPYVGGSERAEALLTRLPVGVVAVNRQYHIQLVNSTARRLLGIHSSVIGEDLIHRVQNVPLLELRNAIDAAFRGVPTTMSVRIDAQHTSRREPTDLEIQCSPETIDGPAGIADVVSILITDVSRFVAEADARDAELKQLSETSRSMEAQVQRVLAMNEELLRANDELSGGFSSLRNENEELLVANEEVQSATEEVETLNEELQATNEELETLNEELQATIEELNTTNDDLEARGIETQDLAISLEVQRLASEVGRQRLDAILTNLSDAVLVIDRSHRIVLCNTAFAGLFGEDGERFRPEDERGVPLEGDALPQRRALAGELVTTEFTMTQPDGTRRWFEVAGQPLVTDTGNLHGVIVIRDTTDRSLRHLQDEFLILASHELRTPLTSLSGSLQLLRRSLRTSDDDPRVNRYLDIAADQIQQLTMLTNDLVDVVRLQTGRLGMTTGPVNLNALATVAVEAAGTLTSTQTITIDAPDEPVVATCDAGRIEQVLMNLLMNAITHAPSSNYIQVRLRRLDDHAELQVRDDGQGIDADDRERIFTRFSHVDSARRSAQPGLGIGLFIAKEIVQAHGGSIDVESAEGEGAAFTVRLPLA